MAHGVMTPSSYSETGSSTPWLASSPQKLGMFISITATKWKTWLMELTTNDGHESCERNTALLLVRTAEICLGRHCSANQNLKLSEYSQLEKLTSSICSKLGSRILSQRASQPALMCSQRSRGGGVGIDGS